MRRRASLALLMSLVAMLAVGLAAMKVATAAASGIVFGSGLLALLVGTLSAFVRCRGRATWIGFALFGWSYALALLVPQLREVVALELPLMGPLENVVNLLRPPPPFPTEPMGVPPSTLLVKEDGHWHYMEGRRVVDLASEAGRPWTNYLDRRDAYEARSDAADHARRIALTYLGLAFALVGSAAGQALGDRPTEAGPSPAPETPAQPG